MISITDLQNRVFNWINTVFSSNRTTFNFSTQANNAYLVDMQTDAPRPAEKTLLFYHVYEPVPFGNMISVDSPVLDRNTQIQSINIHRSVKVTINIVSKKKGDAKSALLFLIAASQTQRGYNASYVSSISATGFNFALYNIDKDIKDLTILENRAWTERVEADFYFNYQDVITFDHQDMITAPSSVALTKSKVDFTINLTN